MRIATFTGTGTKTVKIISSMLDANLKVVSTIAGAQRIQFDRLILLGGADIDPRFYGEKSKYIKSVDRERDAVEWVLIRQAISEEIPVLGICRGMQMINVALGGSLYQDIFKQKMTRYQSQDRRTIR